MRTCHVLLHFIDGVCDALRRSRIDNHIINVSIDQILNSQRTVFVTSKPSKPHSLSPSL